MGKAKLNIPMCAALILLMLTMISIHLTSGLYARYTATATASDSARVAKFDVEGTLTATATNGEYTLTVDNKSEVAVKYKVIVTFGEALPGTDTLAITLSGAGSSALDTAKKIYTFTSDDWTLPPGATGTPHTLTIGINGIDGWQDYTKPVTGSKVDVTLKFSVDIVAEQID